MKSCKVCANFINNRSPGLQCGGFCGQFFHANSKCSDVNKSQLTAINQLPGGSWTCLNCRSRAPMPAIEMGNSEESPNITSDLASNTTNLSTFMNELKSELHELRKSVSFCSDKITDFDEKLQSLNEYLKLTKELKAENIVLKTEIVNLKQKMNNLEQYSRLNNIEIQNLPEKNNENLFRVLEAIANYISCPIMENEIDYIARVPSIAKDKPKNIVIKFISRRKKDHFLSASKSKRNEERQGGFKNGLRIEGIANSFYINEHLTSENKILYKQARETAVSKNYKYTWTQNGNILIRKDDSAKIIYVSNSEVLKKL